MDVVLVVLFFVIDSSNESSFRTFKIQVLTWLLLWVKALKFTLFFRLNSTKLEFKVFYIASAFYILCLLFFFLFKRVFEKNFWSCCMSLVKKTDSLDSQRRSRGGSDYGFTSAYGFLRTGSRPIRMQNSLKLDNGRHSSSKVYNFTIL